MLEVHVVHSRRCFGPDVLSSVTTDELRCLIDGVRFAEEAVRAVDKDAAAARMEGVKEIFGKSVVSTRDLGPGASLGRGDLALRKPGTGIPASRLGEVVGRRLARAVRSGQRISEEDLA